MARYNSQMRDQLSSIRPQRPERSLFKQPLPNTNSIGEDGVDHINIYQEGSTQLGKDLTHEARKSFTHNIFGRFDNISSFWHFIRSEEMDDRTRALYGHRLKNFARELTFRRIPNFYACIMDANWQKVQQHQEIFDQIKKTDLPFDCYYIYNDVVRVRFPFAHWVIWGFKEITSAIHDNREPNFDPLKDDTSLELFQGIVDLSSLKKNKRKEEKKEEKAALTTIEPVLTSTVTVDINPIANETDQIDHELVNELREINNQADQPYVEAISAIDVA